MITPGIGTAIGGVAGGLLGGLSGSDSGGESTIDRETANANSSNALNFSLMDYMRGQGQNTSWENAYNQLMGNYTGDRTNYEGVRDPYTALLLNDITNTGASRDANQQAGNGVYSALADMVTGSKDTYNAGLADINAALKQSAEVYRPAENANINWLQTTGKNAMEGAYNNAQTNVDTANTFLGQANDYYDFSKSVVDPEQTATMAAQDVGSEYDKSAATAARQTQALGIDPSSGASRSLDAQRAVDKALAVAGARTQGRVTGAQQQFTNMGTGLSAVGQGTTAVNSASGTLNNASNNLGSFGVSLGNMLQKGPSSLGTSVVNGIGSLANSAANSFSSFYSNPLSAQLSSAVNNLRPDMSSATTLGTTMGKLGADSMGKIYDATQMANNVSMGSDGSNTGGSSSASSGSGTGSLLGSMMGSYMNSSNKTNAGGMGSMTGGITVKN
jgi:hypothetical protein